MGSMTRLIHDNSRLYKVLAITVYKSEILEGFTTLVALDATSERRLRPADREYPGADSPVNDARGIVYGTSGFRAPEADVLRMLMESNGLTQAQLWKEGGRLRRS